MVYVLGPRKNTIFLLMLVCLVIILKKTNLAHSEEVTLKKEAELLNLNIGAAVSEEYFLNDSNYRMLLKNEFNMLTLENSLKFSQVHPQENSYNYLIPDLILKFAQENGIKVRGHTLVWYQMIPDWLKNKEFNKHLNKEDYQQILKNHIFNVVGRYKDKIIEWDVVNEAFNEDGTLRDNIWLRQIGPEYIELAFIWAHQADPNAKLIYNDFNIEEDNVKTRKVIEYLGNLKQKGIPIDGVGIQMHTSIYKNYNNKELSNIINNFRDIGLSVHITEMDVSLKGKNLEEEERLEKQADIFKNIFNTCVTSGNCHTFVTWGIMDKQSWLVSTQSSDDKPLLFDNNYNPKPSYNAIKDVLESYKYSKD